MEQKKILTNLQASKKCSLNTAFHVAIEKFQDIEIISLFLEKEVNVYALNDDNETTLDIAVKSNKAGFVKIILNKMIEDKGKIDLQNSIKIAALNQKMVIFQHLFDHCTDDRIGNKFIPQEIIDNYTCYKEYFDVFTHKGFSVDPNDKNNPQLLLSAVKNGLTTIVNDLLNLGANIKKKDNLSKKLLFTAVQHERTEILMSLLKYGACPNVINSSGNTPLHIAAERRLKTFVQTFLEHKAHVDVRNNDGMTPLHLVCFKGTNNGETEEVIKKLLQYNAKTESINIKGETPLFIACETLNYEAAKMLVTNNANVNAKNFITGQTPLHCLVESYLKNQLITRYDKPTILDLIQTLLNNGADIYVNNHTGKSPLIIACEGADILVTKTLLSTVSSDSK